MVANIPCPPLSTIALVVIAYIVIEWHNCTSQRIAVVLVVLVDAAEMLTGQGDVDLHAIKVRILVHWDRKLLASAAVF